MELQVKLVTHDTAAFFSDALISDLILGDHITLHLHLCFVSSAPVQSESILQDK